MVYESDCESNSSSKKWSSEINMVWFDLLKHADNVVERMSGQLPPKHVLNYLMSQQQDKNIIWHLLNRLTLSTEILNYSRLRQKTVFGVFSVCDKTNRHDSVIFVNDDISRVWIIEGILAHKRPVFPSNIRIVLLHVLQ